MSDFPLYLNTVAGGLDRRDQTIGGFSFVVKIYNSAIAQEGLSRPWGESVGRTLLEVYGNSVNVRARAAAAAGSDARMNGCEMPVVINSGSGNQGITVSVPVRCLYINASNLLAYCLLENTG